MNFRIYRPAAALHPYVKHYYYWQDTGKGFINLPQNLFSLGDLYMVFLLEGEVSCKPSHHAAFTLPAASMVGHFTCQHQINVKGPVKMVVVQLNAYGCYRLSGLNTSTFSNYYRDLQKQDAAWAQLTQELRVDGNLAMLGVTLDNALTCIMEQQPQALHQMDQVADYVLRRKGHVHMESLTSKFGLSRPTLERKFMEVIGITPQLYARMLRFRNAMRHLQQMSVVQWQTFINSNDYYNQHSFMQDFMFFKGTAPVLNGSQNTPAIAQMPVALPGAVA